MDDDENAEKWYGHDSSFTSKERRILITHWIGEAYEKLTSAAYDHLRLRVWQKTGCLITADGSEDQLIKPEGLKNYVVPPPAYLPPSACLPQIEENPVSGAEDMVSEEEADPEDPCEELPDTDMAEIQEDRFEDRNYNDGLVGRKVTALYENGWFTATVVYFNKELKEYKVDYADKTSDYLSFHDFDGVEVILEPDCRQ